jgi:peptidyl-prolyl cis-trans isomerase A (cyclophilin A)
MHAVHFVTGDGVPTRGYIRRMKTPPYVLGLGCAAALVLSGCTGGPCGGGEAAPLTAADSVLLAPEAPALRETPPDTFWVALETSEGPITLEVIRAWAPLGAFRFYNLVRGGFYDGSRFFRVIPGFVAQFGANGHPAIEAAWADQALPDDPVRVSNLGGTIAFAMAGPGTRVSQVFINYRDNPGLDEHGFAPFGRVVGGMGALLKLESSYGEPEPLGRGPRWECIQEGGNAYLEKSFPRLDQVRRARLVARP